MQISFSLEPLGIIDLAHLAKRKGITEVGLKSLADRFGYVMLKQTKVATSDWAAAELTAAQKKYAAEDIERM